MAYLPFQRFLNVMLIALLCAAAPVAYAQKAKPAKAKPAKTKKRQYQVQAQQQRIDESIAEERALTELIAPYAANIKAKMSVVIGYAPESINKEGIGSGNLGRLITDVIRQQASERSGRKIDLAIQNNGGLRADIPAGDVTVGTVYQLMPFENEIVVIEMSGADLIDLFESMAPAPEDFVAAFSGVELVYGNKKLLSANINNQAINPAATYTMALTDYLYKGGGEYPILQRGKNYHPIGLLLRDAIMNYVRAEQAAGHKIVAPKAARVKIEQSAAASPTK